MTAWSDMKPFFAPDGKKTKIFPPKVLIVTVPSVAFVRVAPLGYRIMTVPLRLVILVTGVAVAFALAMAMAAGERVAAATVAMVLAVAVAGVASITGSIVIEASNLII